MSDPILEIGAQGLETTDQKMQSLMNRMVNTDTPGFKSSDIAIRSFPEELQNAQNRLQAQKPKVDGSFYDFTPGSFSHTGKNTDFAIGVPGFFVVLCPWGEGYTRDGRFYVNRDGELVSTVGNYPLLGKNGNISIPPGSVITVSDDGQIYTETQVIDKIRIVDFENKQALQSINGVVFRDSLGNLSMQEIENPHIVQGFVEASNSDIVNQMKDLVIVSKQYEFDTKIISNRENAMSQAIGLAKTQ